MTKTCPRCQGLCWVRVYSPAAGKMVEADCPECDGCGEVESDEASPAMGLLGSALVAVAGILALWLITRTAL